MVSDSAVASHNAVVSNNDVPWETLPEELTEPVRSSIKKPVINPVKTNKGVTEQAINKPVNQSIPVASPKSPIPINKNAQWHDIVPALNLKGRAAELIKHCLFDTKENGIISLTLDQSSEGLLADSIKQEIETALVTFYGESLSLKLKVANDNKNDPKNVMETPAQRTTRNTLESQQQAEQNIATDPFVIELQNRFGAQIVPGSVQIK